MRVQQPGDCGSVIAGLLLCALIAVVTVAWCVVGVTTILRLAGAG